MEINYKNYQESEFGLIPKEWEVKEIDHFIDLLTGFPFPSQGYSNSGIKLLRGSNIKRGNIDWNQEITEYWPSLTPELREYILLDGDIVISMDGSLVGRSFARLTKNDLPALLLQRVARIRSSKIDMGYLKEFICSSYFTKYCDSVKTSSAIPHISPKDIKDFRIPIPPKITEQTAIATALSDMDALIAQTEKLIEKKKAIKQGVMQELLRPKEGWKKMTLLSISSFINGKPYEGLIIEDGEYDLITLDSVSIDGKLKKSHKKININDNSLNKNDLVVVLSDLAHGKFLGKCGVIPESQKFVLNQRMGRIRVADSYNPYFVHLLINQNQSYFKDRGQGSSQKHIYKKDFASFEISVPSKYEQDWISTVAIDIENQIEIIDDKIQKLKLQKQGMMQALLTGKIRLV